MSLPKISIPLALAASIAVSGAGGALTAGVAMGASKEKLETTISDVTQLKAHDRELYGTVEGLASDVKSMAENQKEQSRAMDRIERHLGTK